MNVAKESIFIRFLVLFLLPLVSLLGCDSTNKTFVADGAGILSDKEEARINTLNMALLRDAGIHIKVITLKRSPGNIDSFAANLFSANQIGKSTANSKGALFLIDPNGRQVRVEIGYGLEHIFTDGFVGYIERKQMVPFFQSGKVGAGVEATVELLVGRALGKVDETFYGPSDTGEFLSGGAGARTEVDIGSGQPEKDLAPDREEFGPQPSPREALEVYRKSLILHIKDPGLGVFTPQTRYFFSSWTVTDAQQDNALRVLDESLPHAETITNGDLAVVLFPVNKRQAPPYFLAKGTHGWMLDFASMNKIIGFNHKNEWFMSSIRHQYMFAFNNVYFDKNGFPYQK